MKDHYYAPSLFETFNARGLSPDEIARTFVPPSDIFSELVTRNNHILVGPRGSGKTTLLKMLTLPALATWNVEPFDSIIPKTDFIGIFVPADRGWHAQLTQASTGVDEELLSIGHSAFTTHVLLSFLRTLRDINRLDGKNIDALAIQPKAMDPATEAAFVSEVSNVWHINPSIRTLGGMSIALRARLVELGTLRKSVRRSQDPSDFFLTRAPYSALNFRDCVAHAIETRDELTKDTVRAWAYLFDEFEIAPSVIQQDIIGNLRGEFNTNILYKVAVAPYNKHLTENHSDISGTPKDDFKVIDLWYPDKTRAYGFSEKLLKRLLQDQGIHVDRLRHVFGDSEFGFPETDDSNPYDTDGRVYESFAALSEMDPSFQTYLREKRIDLNRWDKMNENERAEIRKTRSIVLTREYFLRVDKTIPTKFKGRSRKVQTLYTGVPTILALCEGNPRTLIGITEPMVRKLVHLRQKNANQILSETTQAVQIKLVTNSFRSLLKTIPYGIEGHTVQKGVLRLLDDIGLYFHRKCVLEEFSPQPPLTFVVDSTVDDTVISAIGSALNAGSIIYIPDRGAGPLLTSVRGKRFRLCYLLAAYHKLPIMLNTYVALSTIIGATGGRIRLRRGTDTAQASLLKALEDRDGD